MCRKFPTVARPWISFAKTHIGVERDGLLKTANEDLYNQHSLHESANSDYKLLHLLKIFI